MARMIQVASGDTVGDVGDNRGKGYLGGGFKYFLFQPYLGKISNLTNIFQTG